MLWLGIFSSKFSAKEILQWKEKSQLTTTFAEALDGCRAPTISGTWQWSEKIASKDLNESSVTD